MNQEIKSLNVVKRDGRIVQIDLAKIKNAVEKAFIGSNESY